MELRHLRYFLAVAENLSFTRAARMLGTAQPPLSVQIRNLESELGTSLFDRRGRQVSLTPAGNRFLEEARAILEHADRAVREVQDTAAGRIGSLRLVVEIPALSERMTKRIRKFFRKHPGIRLDIKIVDYHRDISINDWDACLFHSRSHPENAFVAETAGLAVAVPFKHRLADRVQVDPADLTGETLLLGRRLLVAEESLIEAIGPNGAAAVRHDTSWSARLALVSLGVGLMPCLSDLRAPDDVAVRPLVSEGTSIETSLLLHPDSVSPAAQAFADFMAPA